MIYVENLSMITPFGLTDETWKRICNNEVAYDTIKRFDTESQVGIFVLRLQVK